MSPSRTTPSTPSWKAAWSASATTRSWLTWATRARARSRRTNGRTASRRQSGRPSRCCWRPSRATAAWCSSPSARPTASAAGSAIIDDQEGRRHGHRQRSRGRSRAGCWWTSACRCSCRPARWTSAGRATSASTSAARSTRKILKIDEERRNIVISRRKLIEEQREAMKTKLLEKLEVGQVRKGMVKNIADFGAFVDLGGIDGLLHITDMSWGRINHPSEMVKIDQEIEVKVLSVDQEKEKIALGLKQKTPARGRTSRPSTRSASGSRARWSTSCPTARSSSSRRASRAWCTSARCPGPGASTIPARWSAVGDRVEVVVLEINKDKQEICLGMKQAEVNPWDAGGREVPAGHRRRGQGPQPRPTTARSSRSRKASTACCTSRDLSLDQEDRPPLRGAQEGRDGPVRRAGGRPGEAARRPGPQADARRPVADAPSPSTTIPGHDRQGQGHQDHQLRRLRGAGARPRRPAAHQRAGRPQGREPGGDRGGRATRSRSRSSAWTPRSARSA